MDKISEISYLNSSTYAPCFTFNLIGEYSMNENFLVDHICITCDRISELKLLVFSQVCNVPVFDCFGTIAHVQDSMKIHSALVDIVQPTKLIVPMVGSDFPRIGCDLSYSRCLSHALMPSCNDFFFTYICKISCILHTRYNIEHKIDCTTVWSSACYTYRVAQLKHGIHFLMICIF